MSVEETYLTTFAEDEYPCPKSVKEKYGGKCPGYDECPKEVKEKYGGKCPAAKEYQHKLEDLQHTKELKEAREQIEQLKEKIGELEAELKEKSDSLSSRESEVEQLKEEITNLTQKNVETEAQLVAQKEETSQLEKFVKEIILRQLSEAGIDVSGLSEKNHSELYQLLQDHERKEITERISEMAPSADQTMLSELDIESLRKFEEILSNSLKNLPEAMPKKSAPSDESTLSAKMEYTTEGVIRYLRSIKK